MTFKTIDPQRLEEVTAWVEKYPRVAATELMISRGMANKAQSPPPLPPKGPGPRDPRGKK